MHKSKNTCPLHRDCLLKNILYIATITSDKKNYIPRNHKEICENILKKRWANHKRSFNINRYKKDMKLSFHYWNLKAGNSKPKVTWVLKNQFSAHNPQSQTYSHCLNEKLNIRSQRKSFTKQTIWGNIKMPS